MNVWQSNKIGRKEKTMPQLSCRDVSIAYDKITIVKNINFEIEEGDYLCIVGENGSGKSSLIKGILGLIPLLAGNIEFSTNMMRSHVGYLPQQTQVQKDFPASVYEVVLSGCLNRRGWRPYYSRQEKERADFNLKRLRILHLKCNSYRNLSGGQQQRVLLARALCATDKIIFLDEPISGLDPVVTTEFYELIEKLNREDKISIVMVSHDITSAFKSANKILHVQKENSFFGTKEEYQKSNLGKIFLQ